MNAASGSKPANGPAVRTTESVASLGAGPMVWAALAAVDSACSPTELVARLKADGAALSRDRAQHLLDELAARGLVRVAQALEGAERRAVRTNLGDELVRAHRWPEAACWISV